MREISLTLWETPHNTDQAEVSGPEDSTWQSGTAIAVQTRVAGIPVAVNDRVVREKSIRMAIRTGWTPDIDLIWKQQRNDGFETCFGTCSARCDVGCSYYKACRYLSAEPIGPALPTPQYFPEIADN